MKEFNRILLVEDDANLAFVIKDNLEVAGYQIQHKADGEAGWWAFKNESFDLCIFDVMMPKMDGFTLAQKVRASNEQIPIIFLTAKSLKEDRLEGFQHGADDYITKPFSIEELICRIKVFLKRAAVPLATKEETIKMGQYLFLHRNLELNIGEQKRKLTQKEADILLCLYQHRNELVKREQILLKVWGDDDYFLGRSLDVFISRLRKYLSEDVSLEILNHHGVGFRFIV